MNRLNRRRQAVFACLAFVATSASAADRVRAGEWEVSIELGGREIVRSMCLSAADAAAINGDAASIRAYAERTNAGTGCKVLDVTTQGSSVSVKTLCASGRENVGTTTYYGDRSETVNTSGTKAKARRVGECR